jgi:hypothetical protein
MPAHLQPVPTPAGARFQDGSLRAILGIDVEREQLNWYHLDTALRFWQRRSIDGAADEFFNALETLLARFDADWLAQAPRPGGGPPHLPPPGSPIAQVRDSAKPWLPELSGPNQVFNDEMVIE